MQEEPQKAQTSTHSFPRNVIVPFQINLLTNYLEQSYKKKRKPEFIEFDPPTLQSLLFNLYHQFVFKIIL